MNRYEYNRRRSEMSGTNTGRYRPRMTGYEALVTGSLAHDVAMRRPPTPRWGGAFARRVELVTGCYVQAARYTGAYWLYTVSVPDLTYVETREEDVMAIALRHSLTGNKKTAGVVSQATPTVYQLPAPAQPIALLAAINPR
jgi:hypothetical protein